MMAFAIRRVADARNGLATGSAKYACGDDPVRES